MNKYIKINDLYNAIEYDHDIDKWTIDEEELDSLPTFEWISTNDRFPKPEEEVLLFCKSKYGNKKNINVKDFIFLKK